MIPALLGAVLATLYFKGVVSVRDLVGVVAGAILVEIFWLRWKPRA